jgi:hypothetical protein
MDFFILCDFHLRNIDIPYVPIGRPRNKGIPNPACLLAGPERQHVRRQLLSVGRFPPLRRPPLSGGSPPPARAAPEAAEHSPLGAGGRVSLARCAEKTAQLKGAEFFYIKQTRMVR